MTLALRHPVSCYHRDQRPQARPIARRNIWSSQWTRRSCSPPWRDVLTQGKLRLPRSPSCCRRRYAHTRDYRGVAQDQGIPLATAGGASRVRNSASCPTSDSRPHLPRVALDCSGMRADPTTELPIFVLQARKLTAQEKNYLRVNAQSCSTNRIPAGRSAEAITTRLGKPQAVKV